MTRKRKLAVLLSTLALGTALGLFVQRAVADGIPTTGALTYTGYLEDPNGVPVEDKVNINVAVYASAEADEKECEKSVTDVTPIKGRFQVELPDACVDVIKANPDVWIEATVGGTPLGRTKLGAVPYAIEAARATVADNVPIVTEWAAVTDPVMRLDSGAQGTAVSGQTTTMFWRRVGDSLELSIDTSLSATFEDEDFIWEIPDGLAVDADKLAGGATRLGTAFIWITGYGQMATIAQVDTDGEIRVSHASSQAYIGGETPTTLPLYTSIKITVTVPIEGWGVTDQP